jgi:copper chaperone CopZ
MLANNTSVYKPVNRRLPLGLCIALTAGLLGCGQQPQGSSQVQPVASRAVETREFAIEGMSCEGCVATVTSALKAVPGVTSVEVSLQDKKATVAAAQVPAQTIENAVTKAGYKAQLITAAK